MGLRGDGQPPLGSAAVSPNAGYSREGLLIVARTPGGQEAAGSPKQPELHAVRWRNQGWQSLGAALEPLRAQGKRRTLPGVPGLVLVEPEGHIATRRVDEDTGPHLQAGPAQPRHGQNGLHTAKALLEARDIHLVRQPQVALLGSEVPPEPRPWHEGRARWVGEGAPMLGSFPGSLEARLLGFPGALGFRRVVHRRRSPRRDSGIALGTPSKQPKKSASSSALPRAASVSAEPRAPHESSKFARSARQQVGIIPGALRDQGGSGR